MLPESDARASCLYRGFVQHRRYTPVRHQFRYRISLACLDLDELSPSGELAADLAPLWGTRARAPVSFQRRDYLGDPLVPLGDAVRDLVEQRTGSRPRGPIRLLTCLRHFGYGFNPVSFYYCYERGGHALECIVAEVRNTPWLERHCYVLPIPHQRRGDSVQRFTSPKVFHVSPFLEMDCSYSWRLGAPGERISVQIGNRRHGRRLFDAAMSLERVPLSRMSLARSLVAAPMMPARVTAAIYFEALRLRFKGAPYFAHPGQKPEQQARACGGFES